MELIAPIVFWTVAIQLWIVDGPKLPLIFMGLWLLGLLTFLLLGVNSYFFTAFQALLAILLVVIEKYNNAI